MFIKPVSNRDLRIDRDAAEAKVRAMAADHAALHGLTIVSEQSSESVEYIDEDGSSKPAFQNDVTVYRFKMVEADK